jgi:deazaflavin-dependent oxidoreductase (nitroreductase family)
MVRWDNPRVGLRCSIPFESGRVCLAASVAVVEHVRKAFVFYVSEELVKRKLAMTSETSNRPPDNGAIPPKWALKMMTRTHVFLNSLSGGKMFNTLTGDEVCFVTMTGAKSGKTLVFPLMYVPHEEGVILVASQGGAPKNPIWYNNLVKHPDIDVRHRGRKMTLRARLAPAEEKASLWPTCDKHYAPFEDYRNRTDRDIPMFVCEPR